MPLSSVITLVVAAVCAAGGQALFKVGAEGKTEWIAFVNGYIVGGLILYGFGTALWIYALSFEKLVSVYAFTALTFVLVILIGVFFLGETIGVRGAIGIVMVLAGLYLLTTYG